jgi:hypothetical protein
MAISLLKKQEKKPKRTTYAHHVSVELLLLWGSLSSLSVNVKQRFYRYELFISLGFVCLAGLTSLICNQAHRVLLCYTSIPEELV